MVADIAWDGFGSVSTADALAGWTALKISGTGGGPSAAVADGQIEGAGAVTAVTSRQKVVIYYDLGAGNELDFSVGGTEEGQAVYILSKFLADQLLLSQSAGGYGVFLESTAPSTAQAHFWNFYGANNYDGRPVQLTLDPREPASASLGTAINLAAVRYIGVFADVGGTTARFDNLVADAIRVGRGIIVTGTSSVDNLKADLLAHEATNKWGIVKPLNDAQTALAINGRITFGDDTGVLATTITDVSGQFYLEEPLYHDGTQVTNAVPLDFFGIRCVGNATGATDITIGKKVGTGDIASGRSGYLLVGNQTYAFSIDWDDGNVNANKWYGCTFNRLTGPLSWGSNATHECLGNIFDVCSQFDPVGGVVIRNCFFQNSVAASAITLPAGFNVKNSSFISNTTAIDGTDGIVADEIDLDGISFAGNTTDITVASANDISINNLNGSNAATCTNTGAGNCQIVSAVQITITVLNANDTPRPGVRVFAYRASTGTANPIIQDGITDVNGQVSISYTGPSPVGITGWVRDYDLAGDDYVSRDITGTINPPADPSPGFSQTIKLEVE